MTEPVSDLRAILERLARLTAADSHRGGLNPAQSQALAYLSRANRFSRAPSHVAEYLGATRGTVSQTLKALERKGLITAVPAPDDRRSLRYDLTALGTRRMAEAPAADAMLQGLKPAERRALDKGLRAALGAALRLRGGRAFGMCGQCSYHALQETGRRCTLMDIALAPPEAVQICHEQVPAT